MSRVIWDEKINDRLSKIFHKRLRKIVEEEVNNDVGTEIWNKLLNGLGVVQSHHSFQTSDSDQVLVYLFRNIKLLVPSDLATKILVLGELPHLR